MRADSTPLMTAQRSLSPTESDSTHLIEPGAINAHGRVRSPVFRTRFFRRRGPMTSSHGPAFALANFGEILLFAPRSWLNLLPTHTHLTRIMSRPMDSPQDHLPQCCSVRSDAGSRSPHRTKSDRAEPALTPMANGRGASCLDSTILSWHCYLEPRARPHPDPQRRTLAKADPVRTSQPVPIQIRARPALLGVEHPSRSHGTNLRTLD